MKRLKAALGYILITIFSFVLFSFIWVGNVEAEGESSSSAITEIVDFTASDYDKEKAYLFVQDGSEASKTVLDYIKSVSPQSTEYFFVNIVNVPKGGEVYDEFETLYKKKCGVDKLFVPTMIYKDVCTYGAEEISFEIGLKFGLEKENVLLKENIKKNTDIINAEIRDFRQNEMPKSFFGWIKNLNITTIIIIAFVILLSIIGIILVIVFKNKLNVSNKGKAVLLGLQIGFLFASLGFVVYKVNDMQSRYGLLKSDARCIEGLGCDTYDELVQYRVDNAGSEEERQEAVRQQNKYEEQKKKDEELFGSNAAHIVAANVAETGEKVYSKIVNMSVGQKIKLGTVIYTWNGSSLTTGDISVNISKILPYAGPVISDIEILNNDGTPTGKFIPASDFNALVAARAPGDSGNIQRVQEASFKLLEDKGLCAFKNGEKTEYVQCDSAACKSKTDCSDPSSFRKIIVESDGVVKIELVPGSNVYAPMPNVIAKYDSTTSSSVIVPTGKSFVDPCEPGTVGSNVRGPILCNCGHYWTTAVTGDCNQVCRVENLICDTCNPEPEEPPVIPPDVPGTPYCGDGILGNTPGEKCEKGDPAGVSCSWNVCDNKTCTCPTVTTPFCGDGIINVAGEQCEVGDPSGTSCKWETCNRTTCKCIKPGCGDGVLDAGEQCERDNPEGVTCTWDKCNQLKCECIKPGCGDGKLDAGEQCEKNNPTGATCLWEECDKSVCTCDVKVSEYCGDGILQTGEQCELGNPSGTKCTWDKCSKSTCMCPAPTGPAPQTSIFDNAYVRNIVLGATMLLLGFLFYPTTKFIDSLYITIGQGVIKLGRYVTNNGEIRRKRKKKSIEDKFK